MDYQEWKKGFERQFVVFMKKWQSPPSDNTLLYSNERAQLWRSQSQLVYSYMDIKLEQPMELIKEAYNLLDGLLNQESYTVQNVNAAFSNPLVQVVISRTIQRLIVCCWYVKPSVIGMYQESYIIFSKIIEKFWTRRQVNDNLSDAFLMYLERFLYLRLKHRHITEQIGCKYDRKAHKYYLKPSKLDLRYWTPKGSLTKDEGSRLMHEETEKEIVHYINSKNPVQGRIANLWVRGQKQHVIASECGIPLNTVKYHVQQVKKHTRKWMTNTQKNII